MVFTSIVSVLCLPVSSLSDEVIGVHFLPVARIYAFTSSSFVISCFVLAGLLYQEIHKYRAALKDDEKKRFVALTVLMSLVGVLIVFDLFQWKFAYSDWKGTVFNENVQSETEWLILTTSIGLPIVFSKFFRESNINFMLKKHKKIIEREIELSEVN